MTDNVYDIGPACPQFLTRLCGGCIYGRQHHPPRKSPREFGKDIISCLDYIRETLWRWRPQVFGLPREPCYRYAPVNFVSACLCSVALRFGGALPVFIVYIIGSAVSSGVSRCGVFTSRWNFRVSVTRLVRAVSASGSVLDVGKCFERALPRQHLQRRVLGSSCRAIGFGVERTRGRTAT